MTETFLNYRGGRWLWINLGVLCVLVIAYIVIAPVGGRNGGTILGYTYGIIATAGIAHLMWYGIRKRSYRSHRTTLQGCLAAHVWLGLSLAVIVPLHSGMQFGFNIHTLAYVLMVIVIISGVYGAINYSRLAPLIAAHRGGGHTIQLLEQIDRISQDITNLSEQKSAAYQTLRSAVDFEVTPSVWACVRRRLVPNFDKAKAAALLAHVDQAEQPEALKLLTLITRKRDVSSQLAEDVRVLTLLRCWLWVHLPLSIALVLAVIVHIFIVLIYR